MRKKRRRVGDAQRAERWQRNLRLNGRLAGERHGLRRARRKRRELITQRLAFIRRAAVQVDKFAEIIDMGNRVLERGVPGGEQR